MVDLVKRKESSQLYFAKKTKELCQNIPKGSFALVDHEDIDEIAALSLIEKRVKGVLNYAKSMTGLYPSKGTLALVEKQIPVYDVDQPAKLKAIFEQGDHFSIEDCCLWLYKGNEKSPIFVSTLTPYTLSFIFEKLSMAKTKVPERLQLFIENSLKYAQEELDELFKPLALPQLNVCMQGQAVLVVSRGSQYKQDLHALQAFIAEKQPVLVAVDGGADALLEYGYIPDIIIGDMDSASEKALHAAREIVVHAYPDHSAPGINRVEQYGLVAHLFPCLGTSEDAAYLLAYELGAEHIISVGSHTNMLDFLEKGRKGMGSTLLVRLKVGEKLIDSKGIHHLYTHHELHYNTGSV